MTSKPTFRSLFFPIVLLGVATLSCQLFEPRTASPAEPAQPTRVEIIPSATPAPTALPASPTPETCLNGDCVVACMASIADEETLPSNGEDKHLDEDYSNEEGLTLATYKINGDKITLIDKNNKVPKWLAAYRDDLKYHQKLWRLVSMMLPKTVKPYLKEFHIVTDGLDNTLASTYQSDDDMDAWIMDVDVLDSTDTDYFLSTIVHEFSHLITLSPEQVPPSEALFNDPDNTDLYDEEAAVCSTYFPDNCSKPDSYINLFFQRFWAENKFYKRWLKINSMDYGEKYDDALSKFYKDYEDQFVTEYAATNPDEDMAEAFTLFILNPKPAGDTIAEQKILFFYEYPELIQLRQQIAQAICRNFE